MLSHEISSDSSLLHYKKATLNFHYPWRYLHLNGSLIQHYLLSWRKYRKTDHKRNHFFDKRKKGGAVKSFSGGGNLGSCMWRWRGGQSTGEAVRRSQQWTHPHLGITTSETQFTCARKTVTSAETCHWRSQEVAHSDNHWTCRKSVFTPTGVN